MAETRGMRGDEGRSVALRVMRDERSRPASGSAQQCEAARQRDLRLLIGIRERDSRALRAFVERFLPVLLEQARRLHVADGERVTTVTSFLDDIMMSLVKLDPPRALSSYVITSFRRCIAATYRRESAIERQAERHVEDMGASRVIGGSCSEFMLRAAASPDADDASSTVQGSALLRDLMASCTVDERQLLVWMSYRVPLRDCASWLGISYESTRQRVSRLRARLKREGAAILAASSTPDRDVLVRILARSGMRQCDNKPEESEA